MTARIEKIHLLAADEIVAPPAAGACDDHSFELPTGIYVAMAALLFGFMAVMALGFSHPQLVVPMGINFAFLTAFFAVPAIFVGASADSARPLSWSEFRRKGIATATGRCPAGEATVLVLLLPFLIFCWGLAVVAIAALV